MPFFQTAAATSPDGMLGGKDRVPGKRRLLPIVLRPSGGQSVFDKKLSVLFNFRPALFPKVFPVLGLEAESGSEFGPLKPGP